MRIRTCLIMLVVLHAVMLVMARKAPLLTGDDKPNDSVVRTLSIDSMSRDSIKKLFNDSLLRDSVDSLGLDTLDSLHRAIFLRNKAVDDSLRADSINRKQGNTVDFPVYYTSNDSLVYYANTRTAYLYGKSNVKYDNMDLSAEKIDMGMENNIVHATGAMDTTKNERYGLPVFVQGSDRYETDTIAFNFKSKRGLIRNAYTEQQDGYLLSETSKRDAEGNFYIRRGRYTTCDDPNPDFYIALTRAKVRPGKDVIFGPAYLVVQDVPLPLAIPYGFFPFSKSYASGFIMPTYGDENTRGFYLRDGGYYFAISDQIDLKLLGEIFTKGSWGVSAASNYNVRYKYNGQFFVSYQDSRTGDKGFRDYNRTTSFKLQWVHHKAAQANPYSTLSASVNYVSEAYERNNLTSMYNPTTMTQSTRTSSVSWGTGFSSIGMTLNVYTNATQNMRDSTLALNFPNLNMAISRFYPFRRKKAVGKQRWYEKINVSYTMDFSNSITTKESKLFSSSLTKDWRNGIQHVVPINADFNIFKYINITPSVTITDRMYSNKIRRSWDVANQRELLDTINGFYNVMSWTASLTAKTSVYGFFVPNRRIFGDKIQAIRHTITPSLSFNYNPDFSSSSYGYWDTYRKIDTNGNVTDVDYSYFSNSVYGGPGKGKAGRVTLNIDNNIEMKVKSDKDSTGFKKLSIIDLYGVSMSYNMADKERPWGDLYMRLRLKWWKSYTFSMNATFATYAYDLDSSGKPYIGTHTEYSRGRFGRFQGMSQTVSYTLNPDKLRNFFSRFKRSNADEDDEIIDDSKDKTGVETNADPTMMKAQSAARKRNAGKVETDDDGYMAFSMPWSITFSYGINIRENTSGNFDYDSMRYPYKVTQNLNFTGNWRISDGWNIVFTSGYDFEEKKMSMTTASLARDLHCFNLACSVVLVPYTSYNLTFRCNAATLADALKYDKRSSFSNQVQWY